LEALTQGGLVLDDFREQKAAVSGRASNQVNIP
jgi:hypothetical protein